jgi:hypothetical protein
MDGDEFELHNFVAGTEGVNKDDIYVGQSTVLPSLAGRHGRRGGGKAGAGDKLEAPLLPLEATADGPMTTGESWSPAFFRETENHQRAVAPRGMASLPDAAIYSGQRSAAAARAKISTNANFVDTNAPSLLDRMMLPSHATVEGRIRDPRVAAAVAAQVSPFLARAGAFGGLRPDGDENLASGDRTALNASARPLLLRDVASPNPMLLSSASASSAASGGSYYGGGASRLGSPSAVGNATTTAELGAARRLDDILFGAAQRAAPLGGLGARAPLPSYREAATASRLNGNSYLEEVETRLAGYAVDAPHHARSLRSAPPVVPLRLAAAAPALREQQPLDPSLPVVAAGPNGPNLLTTPTSSLLTLLGVSPAAVGADGGPPGSVPPIAPMGAASPLNTVVFPPLQRFVDRHLKHPKPRDLL